MVLLRALLAHLRLLPAHRVATLLADGPTRSPALAYRLTLPGKHGAAAAEAGGAALGFAGAPPQTFGFAPPDAQHGRLLVTVEHRAIRAPRRQRAPDVSYSAPLDARLVEDYVVPPAGPPPMLSAAAAGEAQPSPSAHHHLAQMQHGWTHLGGAPLGRSPPRPIAAPPPADEGEWVHGVRVGATPPKHVHVPLAAPAAPPLPPLPPHAVGAGTSPSSAAAAAAAAAAAESPTAAVFGTPPATIFSAATATSAQTSPAAQPSSLSMTPVLAATPGPLAALGGASRERLPSVDRSREHDLPFAMDDDDVAPPLLASPAVAAAAALAASPGGASSAQQEAVIGSFMMEVTAAPSLQLFSAERSSGRVSPLSRSVDDISQQLDALSRTFHEGGGAASREPRLSSGAASDASAVEGSPAAAGVAGAAVSPLVVPLGPQAEAAVPPLPMPTSLADNRAASPALSDGEAAAEGDEPEAAAGGLADGGGGLRRSDSTEQLLASGSPPSEALFPFAPPQQNT